MEKHPFLLPPHQPEPDAMSCTKVLSGYCNSSNISCSNNSFLSFNTTCKCSGKDCLNSFSANFNCPALTVHLASYLHRISASSAGSISKFSLSASVTTSGKCIDMPLGCPHLTSLLQKSSGVLGMPNCDTLTVTSASKCGTDECQTTSSTRISPLFGQMLMYQFSTQWHWKRPRYLSEPLLYNCHIPTPRVCSSFPAAKRP